MWRRRKEEEEEKKQRSNREEMEADEDKFLLFTENVNTIYVIQQIVLLVLLEDKLYYL